MGLHFFKLKDDFIKISKNAVISTKLYLAQPYWQILENSSKNNSEISVFLGVTQTDLWKTRPHLEVLSFPEIDLCHAPELIKNNFSTICFVLDEFSRNRPVSFPIILKLTVG